MIQKIREFFGLCNHAWSEYESVDVFESFYAKREVENK